jgi:hypothetical protein
MKVETCCAENVGDTTKSQQKMGRHIIWQDEQHVALYNTKNI